MPLAAEVRGIPPNCPSGPQHHFLPIEDVCAMSAYSPITTKMGGATELSLKIHLPVAGSADCASAIICRDLSASRNRDDDHFAATLSQASVRFGQPAFAFM